MANNKGAVIFLAILAIGGLGLSGYMFITDIFFAEEDIQNLKLVASWDYLDKNTDNPLHNSDVDFLIEYSQKMMLDANYVNVINETRFTLPVSGLYRINLNVLLSGLDAGNTYWVLLLRNNSIYEYLDYIKTASPLVSQSHYTKTSVYINSTGGDEYYELNTNGFSDFYVYFGSPYNQFSIEYVIQ